MERRKTTRQSCGEGAFALVKGADDSCNVGRIIDISLSGMGFSTITDSNTVIEPVELTIFLSIKPFIHVNHIPCEAVYDHKTPGYSMGDLSVRHCGVKFGELDFEQISRLTTFLGEFDEAEIAFG
jgi:hypothetical protein